MRTTQEVMEAKERTNANKDSAKPNMIGMMLAAGGDKNRVQMTNAERDDANDSQALTSVTSRSLFARISYLSQDRPDLKFATRKVCCAMAKSISV